MNKIIEVRKNHREFIIESNSSRDSAMRFYGRSDENRYAKNREDMTDLVSLFEQHLIVLTQRRAEDNARYTLKTMDPFLSFRALPSNIKHVNSEWRS